MHFQQEKISDQNILSMIAENNLKGWENLYDKYAPSMYGIICNLTSDRVIAEIILKETFLQLKLEEIFSKVTYALCPCLLRHTHTFAKQQLKERGQSPNQLMEETSIIDILCSQNISLKEVAFKFNITEAEAMKNLRTESLELKNQKKQKVKHIHQREALKEEYSST